MNEQIYDSFILGIQPDVIHVEKLVDGRFSLELVSIHIWLRVFNSIAHNLIVWYAAPNGY